MRRLLAAIVVATSLCALGGARADEVIKYGPPGDWVDVLPLELTPASADGGLARVLLFDNQVRYGAEREDHYNDRALQVLNRQGLEAVGSVGQSWDPATQDLTIHTLQIIRGDEVIDALAQGDKFIALRQETNISRAILDGQLTATKQLEGLQVGDIVRLSYTITYKDELLGGHAQFGQSLQPGGVLERMRQRHLWDANRKMQWRASDGFPKPVLTRTAMGYELSVDARQVKAPIPPAGAPARFQNLGQLMLSDFSSWPEVSALFAPLYKTAATLPRTSPLVQEADKIRQSHQGKLAQASAALAVVEDQVRYLALQMDQGGYRPAHADQTWSRKFGDCKGKSALLIALLTELGIEAEPAMVSSLGDGLNDRLPSLLFDHIIVRAVIDGKTYWLDPTRQGDRDITRLAVPPFVWALPVRAGGAELEALKQTPAETPMLETVLDIDSTGGLTLDAPVVMAITYRGDDAQDMAALLSSMPRSEAERELRERWSNDEWVIDKASFGEIAPDGAFTVTWTGTVKNAWTVGSGSRRQFRAPYTSYNFYVADRPDGTVNADAPFALDFPRYDRIVIRVKLPAHGEGFEVLGADVDIKAGGLRITRHSTIEDGVFTAEEHDRVISAEISSAEVRAAKTKFAASPIKDDVVVRAPRNFVMTVEGAQAAVASRPISVETLIQRARAYLANGQNDLASDDFAESLKLDPGNKEARVGRAQTLAVKGDYEGALAELAEAIRRDPEDAGLRSNRSSLHAFLKNNQLALEEIDAAIALAPSNTRYLQNRAEIKWRSGDTPGALADIDAAIVLSPDNVPLLGLRIDLSHPVDAPYSEKAKAFEALYSSRIEAAPDDVRLYRLRAQHRQRAGDEAGAMADYAKALELEPTPSAYTMRANLYRSQRDQEKALADFEAAIKLDTTNAALLKRAAYHAITSDLDAWLADAQAAMAMTPRDPNAIEEVIYAAIAKEDFDMALTTADAWVKDAPGRTRPLKGRALVYARRGNLDAAIADLTQAMAVPAQSDLEVFDDRWRLAHLLERKGDFAAAVGVLEAARQSAPKNDDVLAALCRTKARGKVELQGVLADCEAAVETAPDNADHVDALAFALLRLDRNAEAVAAYDKALALRPGEAKSLYGRAVAKERLDDKTAWQDASAALLVRPAVSDAFRAVGLGLHNSIVLSRPKAPAAGQRASAEWVTQPNPAKAYPERALALLREGTVTVGCTVASEGNLANCVVISEAPDGFGFGEAALKAAPSGKVRPATIDGVALDGRAMQFRLVFALQ